MNWPFFNKKKRSAAGTAKRRNRTKPNTRTQQPTATTTSNRTQQSTAITPNTCTQQHTAATTSNHTQQHTTVKPNTRTATTTNNLTHQPTTATPTNLTQQPTTATNNLTHQPTTTTNKTLPCNSILSAAYTCLNEISGRLSKMELRQQEAALQLDEIADVLQDDDAAVRPLLEALMALSVQIENFYRFAADDEASSLFAQAKMMWHAAKAAGEAAGFERIDDARIPFDIARHETESSERDDSLPGGYVLRTLKCGYTYKGAVIRRSAVVVNKPVLAEANR